jgi:hypothetical protein
MNEMHSKTQVNFLTSKISLSVQELVHVDGHTDGVNL